MKRIVSAIVALLFALSLSIGVLAGNTMTTPLSQSNIKGAVSVVDGVTTLGKFITSELSEKNKQFMRDWFAAPANTTACFGTAANQPNIQFFRFPADSTFTLSSKATDGIRCNRDVERLYFKVSASSPTICTFVGYSVVKSGDLIAAYSFLISGDPLIDAFFNTNSPAAAYLFQSYEGGLFAFVDDDGLVDSPASSSEPSEPPTPPLEPEIPFNPPGGPPTSTVDSPYLPYDTSIWDALMWYLRDAIGSAGQVLLLIAFIFVAVPAVIQIIRHALVNGKEDGTGGGLI